MKTRKNMKYVAVVMRVAENRSKREHGDWSAFVDDTKEAAITRAIEAANDWRAKYGAYSIIVGQLQERAHVPVKFELVKL
jgi:hypothetical protein